MYINTVQHNNVIIIASFDTETPWAARRAMFVVHTRLLTTAGVLKYLFTYYTPYHHKGFCKPDRNNEPMMVNRNRIEYNIIILFDDASRLNQKETIYFILFNIRELATNLLAIDFPIFLILCPPKILNFYFNKYRVLKVLGITTNSNVYLEFVLPQTRSIGLLEIEPI